MKLVIALVLSFCVAPVEAAIRYVDSSVGSSGNGQSWATAWKQPSNITGLSAGDTVYFSGGSSGQTYTGIADWAPTSGSAGNPITFAVGQDSGHDGMVTFARGTSSGTNAFLLMTTPRYITINGEVNGQRRMTLSGYDHICYTQNTADKHLKLLYLVSTGSIYFCYGGDVELAYSSITAPLSGNDDSLIAHLGDSGTSGLGVNSIHHNYFEVPRKKTAGEGWDVLKWVKDADIYNNTFRAVYNASYTGNQHGDGIQTHSDNIRIYNNYFENFISYPILDEMFGSTSHWYIYNNVMKAVESGVDWGAYACIAVGFSPSTPGTVSNYIIANNTCIGDGNQNGIGFNNPNPAGGTVGTNVRIVNNLLYDAGDVNYLGAPTVSNNVASETNVAFVNNALYPNGDFHLTSAATAAIDDGISPSYLTDVYTTDAAGETRSGTWDVGAYEFIVSTTTTGVSGGVRATGGVRF